MNFSSTGIAYLFLFFSMGFLTYRFFLYWQERKDIVSKISTYFGICFTSLALFKAISGLFFINSHQILVASIIFATFIEGLAAALVFYLIIYLKFPKLSPPIAFWLFFFLGLLATIATVILKPASPFIEPSGAINWGIYLEYPAAFYYSIVRAIILFISFSFLIFIFWQQYSLSNDKFIKKRSLGLGLLLLAGIIIGFIDFLFIRIFNLDAVVRDITMILVSIFLFIIVFLTPKPAKI